MTEVVLLLIGAALPLLGQFILKARDNSEWLKRQRMEAHADLLFEMTLGDVNTSNRINAASGKYRSREPVSFSPENLLRAASRVEILSPPDTQEVVLQVTQSALSAHAQKFAVLAQPYSTQIDDYVSLAQRDIKIDPWQRVRTRFSSGIGGLWPRRKDKASGEVSTASEAKDSRDSQS